MSGNIRNRSRSGLDRKVPLEKDPANLASTSMPWDAMYSSTMLFRRSARSCMDATSSGGGTIFPRTVCSRSMAPRWLDDFKSYPNADRGVRRTGSMPRNPSSL